MSVNSQNINNDLERIFKKHELTGLSVCLVKDKKIVTCVNKGFKDISRNLEVDDKTVFRVASISKMFTATVIMQLYEQGKFKLSDDVSHYLGFQLRNPFFPESPVTFQMLLSHTSSLRDGSGYNEFLSASYHQNPVPSINSVLNSSGTFYSADMWSQDKSPENNFFTYANINFGLLGTLVENISGERFDRYCLKHIFQPLHMDASFDVRDISDINDVAVIYRKQNGNWTAQNDDWKGIRPPSRELDSYSPGTNAVIFAPQGGLRISTTNLAKFLILHQNNGFLNSVKLLSDTTAKRMHQVVWNYNGTNGNSENEFFTDYALGCMHTEKLIPGVDFIGHSGDAYGLLSGLYYSEKENFGVVFVINGGVWNKGSYSGWQDVEEEIVTAVYAYLQGIK